MVEILSLLLCVIAGAFAMWYYMKDQVTKSNKERILKIPIMGTDKSIEITVKNKKIINKNKKDDKKGR